MFEKASKPLPDKDVLIERIFLQGICDHFVEKNPPPQHFGNEEAMEWIMANVEVPPQILKWAYPDLTNKQAIERIRQLKDADAATLRAIADRAVEHKRGRTVVLREATICAFVAKRVYGIRNNATLAEWFYPSNEGGASDPAESLRKAVGQLKKILHHCGIPNEVFSPNLRHWKLSSPTRSMEQ